MSAGGSFNPSGGPIDNQQRLQTSPNPSLPPADYSMGYARNSQSPSFFNPFAGYYGANTGMGGFQSQFGGFQPQFGGFGGFGGFQQPQYGGFQQPQYGGFQQPQYGGFQQPQYGGFQQPQFGGLGGFQQPFGGDYGGGFQQPFSGGFGRQSNRFTRRGQEYTQPYNPQPNQPDYGNMNQFNQPQPQPPQMPPDGGAKRRLPDQSRDLGPNIAYESLLPNRFADPSFSQQQGGMGRMGGGGRGQRFDDGAYGYDLGSQVGTPLGQPQPPQMPPGGGVQRGPLEQTGVKYVPDEINNEYDRAHAIGMRSMRNPGSTTKDELAFLMDYESRKAPVQVNSNFRPQTNMSGDMGGGMGGYDGFNPMMGGIGGFQQRGTVDQNMNNPAFSMQPMPGSNELGRNLPDYRQEQDSFKKYQDMTDYQRLMQKQDDYKKYKARPPMPSPDLRRPLEGGEGIFHPPRDYEIAKSLGYADLGITDMRAKRPEEYQQEETTRQARAKSYLDSIGYGQTGFDPSKYEVKREVQPFSGIGSLFSGLGRG